MCIQGGPKKLGLVNISMVLQFYRFLKARDNSRLVLESLWNEKFEINQFNLFSVNFKCTIFENSDQKY